MTRPKIKIILAVALTITVSSCLKNGENTLNPEASINTFSLGQFRAYYRDINIYGRDTLVYSSYTGTAFKFSIDQSAGTISNKDSLPYGADVSRVTASIGFEGTLYYRKTHKDGSTTDTLFTSTDSIDFTSPVIFKIVSTDESYSREYTVTVNRRAVDPDSLIWKSIGMPLASEMTGTRALLRNDSIFMFGTSKDSTKWGLQVISIASMTCDTIIPAIGLTDTLNAASVILAGNRFYTLDGDSLFCSQNGYEWKRVPTTTKFSSLIKFQDVECLNPYIWAISDQGDIVRSANMIDWETVQPMPAGFPDTHATIITMPLKSNTGILRSVIVGTCNGDATKEYAKVWSKLSTEDSWTQVIPLTGKPLECPGLDNLSVIWYNDAMFAFGGENQALGIVPMNGFWQSSDYGLTWRDCTEFNNGYSTWCYKMQMPDKLKGTTDTYCQVVDEHGYLWIITTNGIWRGAVNKEIK